MPWVTIALCVLAVYIVISLFVYAISKSSNKKGEALFDAIFWPFVIIGEILD